MRTKKAILNIISSGFYQIVSIVCGLIVPRLILSHYGSTYNGVYVSLTQIIGMISILTLGIGGATRVELYKTLGANDILGTSRIMKATNNFMHKVGAALLVYTIVLLIVYPTVSHNNLTFIENDILIIIVSISVFGEYFFALPNKMLLMADQKGYIEKNIYSIARLTETILTIIFVYMGCSVFIVKGAGSIVFLISPIILSIYIKRKYKLISECEPNNAGIKNRNAVVFHSIANTIHNNSDIFLLTLFTDAKILSVYSVYYLVLGKMKSIMQIFTNGLEAAFGNMWVKNEKENFCKRFAMCEHGLYCFVCIVFSCVGLQIIPFIRLYTAGVTDINYIIFSFALLATVTEGIYCIREPYVIIVQATGKYEETKLGAAIEAGINLLISLILIIPLGINGVIIGTLVANVFRMIQYAIFTSKKILQISVSKVCKKILWLIITICIIILFHNYITNKINIQDGWVKWFIQSTIDFIGASIITLFMTIVFYRNCIDQFLSLIKRIND